MFFVIVGTILLILKLAEIGPVADWSWLWILLPFGLAVAWWMYADSTGLTQRRAIRKMEERKVARRERDIVALGMSVGSDRRRRAQRKTAGEALEKSQQRKP